MKKRVFIFNDGELRRKDNTVYVNVNIRMIKKWKIIMYKKWPKAFQNPSSSYYLNIEF